MNQLMPSSSDPRKVAVVGAGRMGAALVRALATAGHDVSVWNRDHSKAEATEVWGAKACRELSDPISRSNYIILCVADYSISSTLLTGLGANALRGKTIIQLTTGSPGDADSFAAFIEAAGAGCLDGAIMSYPKQVGTLACRIVLSGPKATFDEASSMLAAIGELTYIDSKYGSASAMDAAILFYNYGASFAFFQGISLLMAAGVDWSRYADLVIDNEVIADAMRSYTTAIAARYHQGKEATLDVHFAALESIASAAEALKVPNEFIEAVKAQFEKAQKAGRGGDELSAIFEVFRPASGKFA